MPRPFRFALLPLVFAAALAAGCDRTDVADAVPLHTLVPGQAQPVDGRTTLERQRMLHIVNPLGGVTVIPEARPNREVTWRQTRTGYARTRTEAERIADAVELDVRQSEDTLYLEPTAPTPTPTRRWASGLVVYAPSGLIVRVDTLR